MKEKMTKRDIFSNCSYLDVNHFLMETFTGGVNKATLQKATTTRRPTRQCCAFNLSSGISN